MNKKLALRAGPCAVALGALMALGTPAHASPDVGNIGWFSSNHTSVKSQAQPRTMSAQAYSCHFYAYGGGEYAGHYSGNTVVPSPTSVTSAGIEAQCLLSVLGMYTDTIDGIFGPHSQAAMKVAQQAYNESHHKHVAVDGFPGPESWWGLRLLAGGD
ncbi:peptidoglycan-binding domain-containing protein [Streptomyces avermitilis]|uniref:peptidoglycan-binding domain-containing protein n=1 Tax=Streptomyces avermitilis TaxID=33903 RepID=UPI00340AC599